MYRDPPLAATGFFPLLIAAKQDKLLSELLSELQAQIAEWIAGTTTQTRRQPGRFCSKAGRAGTCRQGHPLGC